MGYRDEEEGLRVRVAELEGELAEANATIARLKGEGATEVAAGWGEHDWLLGGPKGLHLERELPFEVTEEGLEAIAEVANQRVDNGSVSNVGKTLTHRRGSYELRVTRTKEGRTRVRVVNDYRAGRVLVALAGMGNAILGGGFLAGIAEAVGLGGAVMAPLFVVGAVLAVIGLRHLVKKSNANDRAMLQGLFETACDLAKSHRVEPDKTRIAVDTGAEAEREAQAVEEAAELEAEALAAQTSSSAS